MGVGFCVGAQFLRAFNLYWLRGSGGFIAHIPSSVGTLAQVEQYRWLRAVNASHELRLKTIFPSVVATFLAPVPAGAAAPGPIATNKGSFDVIR